MTGEHHHDLREIVPHFQIEGRYLEAVPYGSGHINDTYASRFAVNGRTVRYVHQRINHHVFRQPELLMENVERVTRYVREQVTERGGDPQREALTLVPAEDGRYFYRTPAGDYWRTYVFIEGTRTYDQVEDIHQIYVAGRAFGNFQKLLSTMPGARLHETIPNFHHTRCRFEAFVQAKQADVVNRCCEARPEIDFALAREADTSVIVDLLDKGLLPERVTHNDTKLNNVLIDTETGREVCVVDLDTVMPGSALYDFGDAVRVGASTAAEDEQDLSKVGFDLNLFEQLAAGYLETARDFLTPLEVKHLAFSAKLLTFECGMRFLTDFLSDDVYFKTSRPAHNLDRCRTQFKMVADMEAVMPKMKEIVERYATKAA